MSVFDRYGNFVYLNDGSLSSEEEAEEEKKRQEQLCELMSMYQHYRGIVAEPQYVPRGSKLRCQYGIEFVQLDCLEDYGIYRGIWPLLTTLDCRPENIHNFGSCLCPEANYRNRLPMTVANTVDGKTAIKAIYNEFPHICIPLVDEENGWRQVKKDLLVEANAHRDASVLLSNAVLVCQYGGIITVEEVPETEETEDEYKKRLREKGFTEGYIEYLVELHEKYKLWEFEAVLTGVDYSAFVKYQIEKKTKCAETVAYQTNEKFEGEKSDRYRVANEDAIIFFSHPYSMLQTDQGEYENALQFLKADQNLPKDYSDIVVETILFDKEQELIDKIKNSNCKVNPVFMACIIAAENGPIGEMYNDTAVYNIFNFGATNGREAGKKYAFEKGWFSLDACIADCDAEFKSFLERGQNTLYSLDWDYNSFKKNGGVKQYATLVNDAEQKAIMMSKRNGKLFDLDKKFIFSIPIYENIFTYNNEPFAAFPDPNK